MTAAADRGDEQAFSQGPCYFHIALVALSGNRLLEDAYRLLQVQLMLGMALTRTPRPQQALLEDLHRYDRLLRGVEQGEVDTVLAELARHDERDSLEGIESKVDGHTEMAWQWLRRERASMEAT